MSDTTSSSSTSPIWVRPEYHRLVRSEVIPHAGRPGGTALDFGGGVGHTVARLRELGLVERAGIVDLVAEHAISAIDFAYAGDVEDPALIARVAAERGPFSLILCLDILEHLRDPWAAVAALHKSLAPGGAILASIPNVRNYAALVPLLIRNDWQLADSGILDRTHLRFFVRRTAIELMTSSGLELELVVPLPSGGRRITLFRYATLGLLNSFTDMQYLIRVRSRR